MALAVMRAMLRAGGIVHSRSKGQTATLGAKKYPCGGSNISSPKTRSAEKANYLI